MAKAKKFDAVTIVGLIAAAAMLIFGQMYVRSQQERQRQVQIAAAEKLAADKLAAEKLAPEQKGPAPEVKIEGSKNGQPEVTPADVKPEKEPKPKDAAANDEPEPPAGLDVAIHTTRFDLLFTAQGGSLKSVTLADQYTDAADKEKKGVELLAEIEPGKRTFGMPSFDVGPPQAERLKERLLFDQPTGALRSLDQRVWTVAENSSAFDADGNWKLVYTATLRKQYQITKTITVNQNSDLLRCDVTMTNLSGEPVSYMYALNGPAGILLDGPAKDPKRGAYVYVMAELAGREAATGNHQAAVEVKQIDPGTAAKEVDEKSAVSDAENLWGGLKNRFYMAMLISLDPTQLIKIKAVPIKTDPNNIDKRLAEPNEGILGIRKKSEAIQPEKSGPVDRYALYMGPIELERLEQVQTALNAPTLSLGDAIHYCDIFGWRWPRVDWIARQMMWLFNGLHSAFGSYGLAVILLTLVIKLALHPLQRKMTISMQKMAKLQPEIKKIQEKYKGQTSAEVRQKMYLEQQDLMKKAGANPAAGCLPIFLQIPIFSALYGIFNRAFAIRGAEFLWIKDLSQQDHFMTLTFWPHVLNLLPLIYMGVTILQSRLTPSPKSDDPQQEMNRKMMMFMPVMFSLLFYSMPSGLVLYFAASAVFGMLETWYIRKFLIKDEPVSVAGGKNEPSGKKGAVAPAKS